MPSVHQDLDILLKYPIITVKDDLSILTLVIYQVLLKILQILYWSM